MRRWLIPIMMMFGLLMTSVPLSAQEGNGTVTIETEPEGARVVVNGRQMGKTPLQLQMPAGTTLTVTLEAEGFEPVEQQVTFEKGEPLTLKVQLKPVSAESATDDAAKSSPEDDSPDGGDQE